MAADRRRSSVLGTLLLLVAASTVQDVPMMVESSSKSPFTAMIMLGDSTIDVGNNNALLTVIRSDFYPYGRDLTVNLPKGRFSNGLLTPDYLAEDFGFPYQIAYEERAGQEDQLLTGVNFASSGSGWLNLTAEVYNVNSFGKQIDQLRDYKNELISMVGESQAEHIIGNALFIVSTGANDYLLSYFVNPLVQEKYSISEYNELIRESSAKYLKDLYDIGARYMSMTTTPPIGCLPFAISLLSYRGLGKSGCVEDVNEAAHSYNVEAAQKLVPRFEREFPGAKYKLFDTYPYLLDVITNYKSYGYKESRLGCCGTGLVEASILCNAATPGTCKDANEYVFFDSFHPTTRVYKGLGDFLLPLIKEAFF